MIVTHEPEQRFDEHGAELLQVRGTVVDSARRHPMVVVRFDGKQRAELFHWAKPGKHLAVEGYLKVESWTTVDSKIRIAYLVEARDIFPLNPDERDLSRVGITTRESPGRARRAPARDDDRVHLTPKGADRADMLRQMLADA